MLLLERIDVEESTLALTKQERLRDSNRGRFFVMLLAETSGRNVR